MFPRVMLPGLAVVASALALQPFVLKNAAEQGMVAPAVGIGTGTYSRDPKKINTTCWTCANVTYNAVAAFLKQGGRRIDTALCYGTQGQIGRAIKDSGIARSELFVTSKMANCGGGMQGEQEALEQQAQNLKELQVDYTDLLLVHWPGPPDAKLTKDPNCLKPDPDGRWGNCRKATWRGMLKLLDMGKKGGSRAVGVSNFEKDHLMDLMDVGGPDKMPAVNQVEFHPWWHEEDLLALHTKLGIASNSYCPLGTPDLHEWNVSVATDPTLTSIAQATGTSNYQVTLRWQLQKGLMVNPRTRNPAHQKDDLATGEASYSGNLSPAQVARIDAIHPNPRAPPVRKICPDPRSLKSAPPDGTHGAIIQSKDN